MNCFSINDFVEFFQTNPDKFIQICRQLPSKPQKYKYVEYQNHDEMTFHSLENEVGEEITKFYFDLNSMESKKHLESILKKLSVIWGPEELFEGSCSNNFIKEIEKINKIIEDYFQSLKIKYFIFDPIKLIFIENIKEQEK